MSSTLFINGKVWQDDGNFKESFGIKNDSFEFVGSNSQSNQVKDFYDRVIDLKGKTVIPGLIDSHLHLVYGSLMKKRIDCRNVQSLEELKKIIDEHISKKNINSWIIGGNLDINCLGIDYHSGNPLDYISETVPIYIINYDYHSALANTGVFKESGLSTILDKFTDEEIPKLREGIPSGLIKERAMKYIFNRMPNPSLTDKTEAVVDFFHELHSYGITSVCDILLTEDIDVYPELFRQGKLKLRINSYLPAKEYDDIRNYFNIIEKMDANFFKLKGFKFFYDGSLGSQTALYKVNYLGQNHNGMRTEMAASSSISDLIKKIDKNGWQIIIHAIGDKAVDETLSLYEDLIKKNGIKDRRARIEHAQHIDENDFSRIVNTNTIISAQPIHLKYDAELVQKILPETIVKRTHNYKNLINEGVTICFGTDFPIVDVNPFENIEMAVTRKTGENYFYPENKFNINNCIKAYTLNAAYACFNEKNTGSIEKNKKADFVILKDDIFQCAEDKIGAIKVNYTYLNGEIVYSAPD